MPDIPTERYADAVATVARGHRKTDLFDPALYPTDYDLGDDKRANLAPLRYLSDGRLIILSPQVSEQAQTEE